MAVDFGILAQTPSIGARYAEGLQLAQAEQERNMLRAMQMQQMQMQQKNMLAQDEERKAIAQQRTQQAAKLKADMDRAARNEKLLAGLGDVLRKNGYKMDRPTLGHIYEVSSQTGDEAGAKLAMAGLQALDETERAAAERTRIFGGAPAVGAAPAAAPSMMRQPPAAVTPAAPTNMFAGTMADIGTMQPAPVNALAAPPQAPTAAPAAPAVGGPTREQVQQMILSPSKSVREQGAALARTLLKEDATTPVGRLIAERDALPAGDPRRATYDAAIKKATTHQEPQKVDVKVQAYVPASEAAQRDYIGSISKERDALRNASDTLANVDKARNLIPGAKGFMGAGGEPLLKAASFLNNRLGFNIDTKGVADATELRTRLFEGIMDNLKRLDSQPSQEQQRIMQEALGTLGTDPSALPRVLDKIEETVRGRVARYNEDVTDAEGRGVKFPFKPQIKLPERKAEPAPSPIPTGPAPAPAAVGAPIYAVNPTTKQRIMSTDGGRNWVPAPAR